MNADAAKGVAVDVKLGVNVSYLGWSVGRSSPSAPCLAAAPPT